MITLSQESICKNPIPSQDQLGQYSWVGTAQFQLCYAMPLFSIFGTFRGAADETNQKPGAHCRCAVDIFSYITNVEQQELGIVIM